MADKSIFSLELETATFDRFKKDFDEYHKSLGSTVSAWKSAAKAINDAKDAVKNLNQMTRSTTTATQALTGATKSYAGAVASALGYWSRTATQVNNIANNIQSAAAAVQRMRSGGGGLGLPPPPRVPPPPSPPPPPTGGGGPPTGGGQTGAGVAGGGGYGALNNAANQLQRVSNVLTSNIFGTGGAGSAHVGGMANELTGVIKRGITNPIEGVLAALGIVGGGLAAAPFMVAPGVAALRKSSLGLGGIPISQLRAAEAASSWLNDPTGILANMVTARRDPTSEARLTMANLFGGRADEMLARSKTNPGGVALTSLREAAKQLMGYNEEDRDMMADTLGYSGMFGAGNLRMAQSMSDKDWQERQASWDKTNAATRTTPQEDRAWFQFYDKMQQTGAILEATIIKKLAPLQGPLERMMDEFTKFIDSDVFDQMVKSFGDFISSIKKEDVEAGVKNIAQALADLYKGLQFFLTGINWINAHWPSSWGHLGGATGADIQKNLDMGYDRHGAKINPDGSSANFPAPGAAIADSKAAIAGAPAEGPAPPSLPPPEKVIRGPGGIALPSMNFDAGPQPTEEQQKALAEILRRRAADLPSPDAGEKSFDAGGSGTGFRVPGTDEVVDEQKKTNALLSDIKDSMDKATEIEGPMRGTIGAGGVAGGGPGVGGRGTGAGPKGAPGVDYNATTLPFSKGEYKALTQGVADLESGGKYDIAGGAGGHYLGRYQMGAREIAESAKELGVTPPTPDEFRKNPELQEKLYERYTLDHYNEMMKDPMFASASRAKQLQALGAAQLGVPAGLKWLHGSDTKDAWGTPTSRWAGAVARRESEGGMTGVTGGPDAGVAGGFAAPMKGGKGFGSALGVDLGAKITDPKTANLIDGYLREAGVPINAHTQAWCAAWVNAQLAHEGIMGSNSNLAASFNQWGKAERALAAHRGDIMVAASGSHVGRYTGRSRTGPGGQTQYEMESGNTGHGVGLQWVTEGQYNFRGLANGGGGGGDDASAAVSKVLPRSRGKHAAATRPQGDDQQAMLVTNPLGLGNWQMTQKTAFALHNKTGSDVFIGASVMAG